MISKNMHQFDKYIAEEVERVQFSYDGNDWLRLSTDLESYNATTKVKAQNKSLKFLFTITTAVLVAIVIYFLMARATTSTPVINQPVDNPKMHAAPIEAEADEAEAESIGTPQNNEKRVERQIERRKPREFQGLPVPAMQEIEFDKTTESLRTRQIPIIPSDPSIDEPKEKKKKHLMW